MENAPRITMENALAAAGRVVVGAPRPRRPELRPPHRGLRGSLPHGRRRRHVPGTCWLESAATRLAAGRVVAATRAAGAVLTDGAGAVAAVAPEARFSRAIGLGKKRPQVLRGLRIAERSEFRVLRDRGAVPSEGGRQSKYRKDAVAQQPTARQE